MTSDVKVNRIVSQCVGDATASQKKVESTSQVKSVVSFIRCALIYFESFLMSAPWLALLAGRKRETGERVRVPMHIVFWEGSVGATYQRARVQRHCVFGASHGTSRDRRRA